MENGKRGLVKLQKADNGAQDSDYEFTDLKPSDRATTLAVTFDCNFDTACRMS